MTEQEADDDALANAIYVGVVNPDLTWWDDLTPEMQDAYRAGARAVRQFLATPQAPDTGLREALDRVQKFIDTGLQGWGSPDLLEALIVVHRAVKEWPDTGRDAEIERRVLNDVARQHTGHFLRLDSDLSLVCHVDGSVLIGDLSTLRTTPDTSRGEARDE